VNTAAPELPVYYDTGPDGISEPVTVTVDPVATDEPEPDEDPRADSKEILAGLLRLLCDENASALVVGQRTLAIGYLAGAVAAGSDKELADRLGISASRLSHIKRTIPNELASLVKCKRRQKPGSRKLAPLVTTTEFEL